MYGLIVIVALILSTTVLSAGAESAYDRAREAALAFKREGDVPEDYDTMPIKQDTSSNGLVKKHVTGTYASTKRPYSAWLALANPQAFSFYPPDPKGCTSYHQVSSVSVANWHDYCEYATNGGFFIMNSNAAANNGTLCVGNLISDGKKVQINQEGLAKASFGVSSSAIYTGFFAEASVEALGMQNLISGVGWLVRNSKSNVDSSPDFAKPASDQTFVTEKAPRTLIGVNKEGLLALLEIDGAEATNEGPDLYEAAELAISLGLVTVINMDGGGSSVSVNNGKVISLPTCKESTKTPCERRTTTFACIKKM